ncbi:hypothetical protein [Actinomadura miaoliensis]|uniref:Uncharacterized protein n=1 Tax=Actinomadura miaoliensis TaxID=430685 RepID=A0ABP7VI82_9ACTN
MTRGTAARGRRQRPANARAAADGMKLHRRVLRLDGRDHTVIGLRPGTAARFSTNLFHGTWHVLSDGHGARLLGRLLWGLAYQARPGTLIVIDRPFLTSTPFDADPADPIVLVPGWATPFGPDAAGDLKARLPLASAPDGTVRWRTHGLDRALDDIRAWFEADSPYWSPDRGGVERLRGLIVVRPQDRVTARTWAVLSGRMHAPRRHSRHAYLGPWNHGHTGEIQIFPDFRRKVSLARLARAQVLEGLRLEETQTPGLTLDALWAMDGALSGTDPRELPAGRRNELLGELRRVKGRLVRRGRRR